MKRVLILIMVSVMIFTMSCQKNETAVSDESENSEIGSSVDQTNEESIEINKDLSNMDNDELLSYLKNCKVDFFPLNEKQKAPEYTTPENPVRSTEISAAVANPTVEAISGMAKACILCTVANSYEGYYSNPEAEEYFKQTGERLVDADGQIVQSNWVTSWDVNVDKIYFNYTDKDITDTVKVCCFGQPNLYYIDQTTTEIEGDVKRLNLYLTEGNRYIIFLLDESDTQVDSSDFSVYFGGKSVFSSIKDTLGDGFEGVDTKFTNGKYVIDSQTLLDDIAGYLENNKNKK